MIHFVFYKTNDVFLAEEILQENFLNAEIVPTPVQDKAYCGVCIGVKNDDAEIVERFLQNLQYEKF